MAEKTLSNEEEKQTDLFHMQERLANLNEQLKQTEALYFKLQGAIELLESLENEKSVVKDTKK